MFAFVKYTCCFPVKQSGQHKDDEIAFNYVGVE